MQFLNKEAAYEKRNKLTACFAEPPLFWAAQAAQGPGADSGFDPIGSAPAPVPAPEKNAAPTPAPDTKICHFKLYKI